MIGKVFNRYTVLGNVNNRVIIAHNPKAVEPWVVWWLDSDGDPYSGSYFASRNAAAKEFMERAFTGQPRECTHYTTNECHIKEDLWID